MGKIAIVRVRGLFGIKPSIAYALTSLRLHKVNHCAVYEDSPSLQGMLRTCKDYVCFGEVKGETLSHLASKRGNLLDKRRELESTAQNVKSDAKPSNGAGGNTSAPGKKSGNMLFALHAPRGGWNGTIKRRFPKGAAGLRNDMDSLLVLMG